MKKRSPKNRKIGSATANSFRMEKRTPRGLKGEPRKKALPPWRDVKDELK